MLTVLVQHCETGLFLAENSTWAGSYRDALSFGGTAQAHRHCADKKIENVRIVLRFSDTIGDVLLPVRGTVGAQTERKEGKPKSRTPLLLLVILLIVALAAAIFYRTQPPPAPRLAPLSTNIVTKGTNG